MNSGLVAFLWRHLGGLRGFLWQSVIMIVLMAVVNLPLPLLQKVAIDELIPGGQTWPLIALGVFAFLVRGMASGFQVLQNYVIRRVTAGLGFRLRNRMVAALLDAPYERFVKGEISSLVGRLNTDVQRSEELIFDAIRFVIRPAAMMALMVTVMLLLSWQVTVILLIVTPICFQIMWRIDAGVEALEKEVQQRRQALQHDVADTLDNIRAIRCFAREDRFEKGLQGSIDRYTGAAVSHAMREQGMHVLTDLLLNLPWIACVFVGSWMVRDGSLTLGAFWALLTFEQLMRSPVGQATWFISQIKAKRVAADRVHEVCRLGSEHTDGSAGLSDVKGAISIEGLHFGYDPEKAVLRGLSMQVQAGQRIAIVGSSGAGKTTLVNLLLGFYQPQAGSISIDGVNLATAQRRSLRQAIGVVFQDNPMFDGSIRDNVRLDLQDVRDDAIWAVLKQAEAADFVKEQPEALDTVIGTKGLKLSGGQRQRLAIARVLLRNPPIVLLDEATSSLDSLSEQRIQNAFNTLLAQRTSITIAHRLSTVVASDRIIYLHQGRIVEDGSHADLLAKKGYYFELYQTQVDGLLP